MDEQIHLNRRVHRKTIIRYTAHEPIINNPEMKVERTKEENIQKCYPEYWCIMVFVVCVFGVRLSISPLVCGVCARLKLADDNRVEREKNRARQTRVDKILLECGVGCDSQTCSLHNTSRDQRIWRDAPAHRPTLLFGVSHVDGNSWQLYHFGSIHFALFAARSFCFLFFIFIIILALFVHTNNK